MTTVLSRLRAGEIAQSHWDWINVDALLKLAGTREAESDFGFLLRHYWTPATELEYEIIREQISSDVVLREEFVLSQRMLKCDADICLWRETLLERKVPAAGPLAIGRPVCEQICTFNRSKQNFRVTDLSGASDESISGPGCVFLMQPVLTPLLPMPVGFRWHVANDSGYMNFHLEFHVTSSNSSVLLIRRHGKFSLNRTEETARSSGQNLRIEREGVTAFSPARSLVLEDRTRDRVQVTSSNSCSSEVYLYSTQRLVRSGPICQ